MIMTKSEHTTTVLQLERKLFAVTRNNVFQGLAEESAKTLGQLGAEGWELVAVLRFRPAAPV